MSPTTFLLLQNQAQVAQWIRNLAASPAIWSVVTTLVLTLLGALYRSEQKRQHLQIVNLLKGSERRMEKETEERLEKHTKAIFEEADRRYEPRHLPLMKGRA